MAKVVKLHPSIRENHLPRLSAAALAEYLIMKPDQQEKVLHDSRFSSPPVVTPHMAAMTAIRAYCADLHRSKRILDGARQAQKVRSTDQTITPKMREESLRCIETLDLFELGENALGLRPLRLEECPRLAPINVSGVVLSIQLDLISRTGSSRPKSGGIIFRPQKAPDPAACRLEETKRQRGEHRREMARYMLAMVQMLFEERAETLGEFDRDAAFVADIRMGEAIPFSTADHAARIRAIKAACRQVYALWDGIEPRGSALAKD
jgi:hypothetical protein